MIHDSVNEDHPDSAAPIDPADYCRAIETHLCRRNEGHLIRIVGPVFEQVSGWAAQGVPLAVACRGIDRYCERYYAKGPRRRPVRVEFCEADVLELFDDWRRAVGVSRIDERPAGEQASGARDSLPAHIDRAIARLTATRASGLSTAFDRIVDEAVRELDRARGTAKHARGDARSAIVDRLSALDRELLAAADAEIDGDRRAALLAEARSALAPFAARMTPDVHERAIEAAFARLLREAFGLPVLSPEPS